MQTSKLSTLSKQGWATDLLPQALQFGSHLGLSVLFVGLHFVGQLFFRHLTEVVVLLYGFLKHLLLVLPLLRQLLQDLGFMGLKNV